MDCVLLYCVVVDLFGVGCVGCVGIYFCVEWLFLGVGVDLGWWCGVYYCGCGGVVWVMDYGLEFGFGWFYFGSVVFGDFVFCDVEVICGWVDFWG